MALLLISAALVHAAVPLSDAGPVVVAVGGKVRASQIGAVPAQRDAVVATMPEGASEVAMSEASRLLLIRNRYPGARYRLRHDGPLRIVRDAAAEASAQCVVTRAPISAGAYLTKDDLGAARCRREAAGGLVSYDVAARSYFARQPIPTGTYLGRMPADPPSSAAEGTELVYRTKEGPIIVERDVIALQSGRAGRSIFVRTNEGKVLSATLAGVDETE